MLNLYISMERRKPGLKKLSKATMHPKKPMTKEQKQVTAWLKENVPTKKTKFLHSHVVEYFIGARAVDMLLEDSPWAEKNAKEGEEGKLVLTSRDQVEELLDTLLRYKMFHRARKIPVTEEKDGKKSKKKDKSDSEPEKAEADVEERKVSQGSMEGEEKKKKRRIRLDMHLEQMFVDCSDAYVWLYDPMPLYYWLVGGLIVLAVIGLCLFPLWPRKVRRGSHWLAWLAACFMLGVLGIAILKYAIFSVLYVLSGWKFKFWIFPNLTEDVTFLESFWPLYGYTYSGEVVREEGEETDHLQADMAHDSDSNESGKSGFEIIEKSKED